MTTSTMEVSYAAATLLASGMCGCAACQSLASGSGSLDRAFASVGAADHVGVRGAELIAQIANGDGTYSFSGDRNIDAVLIGSRWTSTTLTYTFPTDDDYGPAQYAVGQFVFNAQQQEAARAGFRMIESYTGLTITEVAPEAAEQATFRLSNTPAVGSAQGGFPAFIGGEGGDIWFGRSEQPYYEAPQKGNWGFYTMLHEIGHTMGLKHGQDDYSSDDIGSIFEGAGVRYGSQALEYDKDGQAWSLMTYTGGPFGSTGFEGEGANQAQSFMQYDIAAMQYLYGANFTTNAGDTVYRWDAATGQAFISDVGQGLPGGNKVFETIWDGGGVDTYDLSNYNGGITIDLRPGAFSTFSLDQRADNNALSGGNLAAPGNVANALLYQGDVRSLIENAIGGAGNDALIGNQIANLLVGAAGDDILTGGAGSDTLVGGSGTDIADFTGATSGITVTVDRSATDLRVVNGVDTDVLSGIEGVIGTAFNDVLTGDAGANTLSGGAGGRDTLTGGGGDDVLIGGGYVLAYRDEADVVRSGAATNRSIATAISLDGAFELVDREGVSSRPDYPGAVLPHATVVADAGGSAGVDYYAFTATAGSRALFDIDDTNNYTGLEILDAAGNVVASNYFEAGSDDGSRRGFDARLAYTFETEGSFYVRVTGSTFSRERREVQANQSYTLHVSLENAAIAAPVIRQAGSAVFDGGSGDDRIVAGAGDDRIDGGIGRDTLSYENHFRGVAVDLGLATAQDTGAGRDTIVNVENLTGTRFADRLGGNAGANVIDGGGGNDTLDGGAGVDTLSFASQAAAVSVSLAGQGSAQAYRLGQTVTATGFENLIGSAGNDVLVGDAGSNTINGGAGDDTLSVDAGGRIGGRDVLIGGAGSDTASFATFGAAIVASLKDDGTGYVTAGGTGTATLREIENLIGGNGNDRLTGNAAANALAGGAGDDRLLGGAGDDRLDGGAGDDFLDGGAGVDTAVFAGATGATIDLRITRAQDTAYGRDRLVGIENLVTGSGDDRIRGNAADNLFVDGGGNDSYDGDAGFDTLSFASATAAVTVDLSLTDRQNSGALGFKQITGIEGLLGGDGADYLTGSVVGNRIDGGSGSDLLAGGAGADTLFGDTGDDALFGDLLGTADGTGGADRLSGGAGADTLVGGAGNDVLDGGEGNDLLTNGSFASTVAAGPSGLSLTRGNLIRVDGGDDDIDGGAGDDFAVLAYNGRRDGIFVDVRDPTVRTAILANGIAAGSIASIEKLGFEGGEGNDTVYGGAGYDIIAAHGGDDLIDAGQGDDLIFVDRGDDTINGGGGIDIISFADATGDVTFDLLRTDRQDTGGAGRITASNLEQVVTSRFGDTIYLTERNDNLSDYDGGDDRLYGRGGDDRLFIQRGGAAPSTILLDGGDGNDDLSLLSFDDNLHTITMIGGAGNDAMVVVGALSTIVDAGSGNDYIGLTLGGRAGQNAFTITMGEGADRLYFGSDPGTVSVDRDDTIITDFSTREDVLQMASFIETQYDAEGNPFRLLTNYVGGDDPFRTGYLLLTQSGTSTLVQIDRDAGGDAAGPVTILTLQNVVATDLSAANFFIQPNDINDTLVSDPGWAFVTPTFGTDAAETVSGSDGRDRLFGLAGDDLVQGFGGDDVLRGGAGNDTLVGGSGRDWLYGDGGDDVFAFALALDADGDAVREFTAGDRIDLSAIARSDDAAWAWIGDAEFSQVAGQLRVTTDTAGLHTITGDVNGDGIADFSLTVSGQQNIVIADFIL